MSRRLATSPSKSIHAGVLKTRPYTLSSSYFPPFGLDHQETLAGMIDNVQQAAADSVEHDLDRAARDKRTEDIAPGMHHPLGEP